MLAKVTAIKQAVVEERLVSLEQTYALTPKLNERVFPDGTLTQHYRFIHARYQKAFYELFVQARKEEISKAIAEALENLYGDQRGTIASELARLYETARVFKRAVEYFILAAKSNSEKFAHLESAALTRRGLECLKNLADDHERISLELELQVLHGFSAGIAIGLAELEVEESFSRAEEIFRQIGGGDDEQLFHIIWGRWAYALVASKYWDAKVLADELLLLAQSSDKNLLLTAAYMAVGFAEHFRGNLVAGHRHMQQAIDYHHPENHQDYVRAFTIVPAVYCKSNMVRTLWLLGYPKQAEVMAMNALSMAKENKDSDPRSFAFVLV